MISNLLVFRLTKVYKISLTVTMKEFQCDICEKVFSTIVKLKKHYNNNHKNSDNTLPQCNICFKSFQAVKISKLHMKSVHGGKRYKCKSCSKSFTQLGNLNKHIYTIHKGFKDFKCGSCGKSFSQAEHLKLSLIHI